MLISMNSIPYIDDPALGLRVIDTQSSTCLFIFVVVLFPSNTDYCTGVVNR